MALFQVRCPEEVDVFTVPHIRMKQLVSEVSEKLSATDFQDTVSLNGLLFCINAIFHELKRHEEIENKCIMGQLQHRLTTEHNSLIVSEIHKDSHVPQILSLVKKGFESSTKKALLNWTSFKVKLTKAMAEFQQDFLPHMKHEEEVFQPLLMEYFTFDELREIKAEVLALHLMFYQEELNNSSHFAKDNKSSHTDSSSDCGINESLLTTAVRIKCQAQQKKNFFAETFNDGTELVEHIEPRTQTLITDLPSELIVKIFSLLGPRDLCRSAQVCLSWSYLAKDGLLWHELYPMRWIFNSDWRFGEDDVEICGCNDEVDEDCVSTRSSFVDTDTDLNESDCYDDEGNNIGLATKMHQLLGLVRYLLPAVGSTVRVLKLGCCPALSNGLAFKILSQCPNLRCLDLTQTAVSDLGFNGLFRKGGGSHLEHLDVSGCKTITDKTLVKLSSALMKKNTDNVTDIEDSSCECVSKCGCNKAENGQFMLPWKGLVHLGLSGCHQITDSGLRALVKHNAVLDLRYLDLSGCVSVTAQGLLDLVSVCPLLDHSQFYYCDNIDEGPYPDTASGCQNLQCKHRVCCRTGE